MAVNATHITFSNKLVDALTNLGQSVLHKQVVVQKVEKETIEVTILSLENEVKLVSLKDTCCTVTTKGGMKILLPVG